MTEGADPVNPGGQTPWWPPSTAQRFPPQSGPAAGTSRPAAESGPVSGQYIPPGNGSNAGGGRTPPPPPRRPAGRQAPNRRALLWTIIIATLAAILVLNHKITSTEIILFCCIVPSIILHEISHGWVALAFGDDTAKRAGRLTLNPLAHVDPVGTLLVPGLLALSGLGFFGWAKPVPVNLNRLRSPRNQGVVVSLAGPATNLVLAAVAGVLFVALHAAAQADTVSPPLWTEVLFYFGLVNVGLAVFNLLPIPPLDGSVLVERLLPRAWWPGYLRLRRYSMPILLGLVLINFYLHPGPITWLFDRIDQAWANLLGV